MAATVLPAVIKEARQRRRKRRQGLVLALAVIVAAAVAAYELWPGAGHPLVGTAHPRTRPVPALPSAHTGETLSLAVVFGGSTNSGKLTKFDQPLGIFRRPRTAGDTFAGFGFVRQAAAIGKPLLSQSRLVPGSPGPVYAMPTTTGAVCFAGTDFSACQPGPTRQGISFSLSNDGSQSDLTVVGVAANDVASISLASPGLRRRAQLSGNVFVVHWPNGIHAAQRNEGRLIVGYADGRAPASVSLGRRS